MLVKEFIEILKGFNQDAEVVVRDHANDEDDTVGNAFVMVDTQEGYFDEEVGNFFSVEEVDPDEDEVFGVEAVAVCFERLD